VRARVVPRPEQYPWSSARAHVLGEEDALLSPSPLLATGSDWAAFLAEGMRPEAAKEFRRHEGTGRPLGSDAFITRVEGLLGRVLRPGKPGRRPAVEIGQLPTTPSNEEPRIVSPDQGELRIVSPDIGMSPELLTDFRA